MNIFKNKIVPLFLVALVAVGAFLLGGVLINGSEPATADATSTTGNTVAATYQAQDVTSIYQAVSPAVFEIQVEEQTSGFFGGMTQGIGSGFLIDSEGYILTNNHVVSGATSVTVVLDDGSTIDATVVGTDSLDDLALIKVDASRVSGVTPLVLADSSAVIPGQLAIAMGAPFGLNDTITIGIVSGLNRTVDDSNGSLYGMIQTDAAISPGNSGGPLLNAEGQVIGINTAIEAASQANDIGFSIPSNMAASVIPSLKAGQTVTRPWIGISGVAITSSLAEELGLPVDQGVYVVSVIADSPASDAGLVAADTTDSGDMGTGGDIITAVDGQSVTSVQDLSQYIRTKSVGDTVTLTVLRDGQTISVNVTLGTWPETGVTQTTPTPNFDFQFPWGGNSR